MGDDFCLLSHDLGGASNGGAARVQLTLGAKSVALKLKYPDCNLPFVIRNFRSTGKAAQFPHQQVDGCGWVVCSRVGWIVLGKQSLGMADSGFHSCS